MRNHPFFPRLFLSLAVALLALGVMTVPGQAATCLRYHTVRAGEDVGQISRMYGLDWTELVWLNNIPYPGTIYVGQVLCVQQTDKNYPTPPAPVYSTDQYLRFKIIAVLKDQYVTIETTNLNARDTYRVTMGPIGTQGIGGILVDQLYSARGGTVMATFSIPGRLRGSGTIAIRLESSSGSYYYNWFKNSTKNSWSSSPYTDVNYRGQPSFSITRVVPNRSVTIRCTNFQSNDDIEVSIGRMNSKSDHGFVVGHYRTNRNGVLNVTVEIPDTLRGARRLAIRVESLDTGLAYVDWFYNK